MTSFNFSIYSKDNCPHCVNAKKLLEKEGYTYTETVIGKDMLREDFIALFPEQRTVPLIFVNGEKIGGYAELKQWVDTKLLS